MPYSPSVVIALLAGLAAGLLLGVALASGFRRRDDGLTAAALAELRLGAAAEREAAVRAAVDHVVTMNREVLGAQVDASRHDLAVRHSSIGSELAQVRNDLRAELGQVRDLVDRLGAMSAQRFGEVSARLAEQAEASAVLAATTHALREALASPKARGQWGERLAEDVLRMAGFVEHVNYEKQTAVAGGRSIPDFTFTLPKGHVLYMDVKFPVTAYLRAMEAASDVERQAHEASFIRDVRLRVRELAAREYADRSRRSFDQVLLFLPNETISSFLYERDPRLFDDALRDGIVLCSPLTLFTLLGVIRQAFDTFMVEQTSDEILRLIGSFEKEWGRFGEGLDKLARRVEGLSADVDALTGTRRRALQRPLDRLEELRRERGLSPADDDGAHVVSLRA